jgi:sulfopropanediol 3-dehydrogenase
MRVLKNGNHRLFETEHETSEIVSEMLLDLERNGLDAVRRYSKKFDDWDPPSFELGAQQIRSLTADLAPQVTRDTEFCQSNVRRFAEAQLQTLQSLELEIRPGITLGHRHIPVNSVGAYIPGGRYPIFASAHMNIIPAKVAGVRNVVACTPPAKRGGCFPATINAMHRAGADRIFVLGGVPGVALMVFGMDDVQPVDFLCGAGNKYVAEAKRQLFGRCGIDLLAGPTEIAIIADDLADPTLVACDLLGQAEHDVESGICLICFSDEFAHETISEVERQLETLPTRDVASVAWSRNGIVYVAEDVDEAISLSDGYAPEHLELHVEKPGVYVDKLRNYGSLFIGEETTVAYGDKSIGTNHVLPTSRAARYTGGLWVGKFLKTCTFQRMTRSASREIGEVTERQCRVEGMIAHAITAAERVRRYSS